MASEDWYADHLALLLRKPNPTEADVSAVLVRPVLERELAFGLAQIDAEAASGTGKRLRPDFVCGDPNTEVAKVIVEVKRLGTSLDRRRGNQGWWSSPAGQLHRYLDQHRRAGAGTWGVLTNGTYWLVVQRTDEGCPMEAFGNIREARTLPEVRSLLAGIASAHTPTKTKRKRADSTIDWLDAISICASPIEFISQVAPNADVKTRGSGTCFAKVGEHPVAGELFPKPVMVACLEINLPDGHLVPPDISERLRALGLSGRVVGVAYGKDPAGLRRVRGFHSDDGNLLATALVDPDFPGSRALGQFRTLAAHATDPSPTAILDALSSAPLHRRFHEEVAKWFKDGSAGLNEQQRGNMLRHLIRVMFAWLLQVRGVIPDDALWLPTRRPRGNYAVHQHVMWLFSDVLSTPEGERTDESDDWRQSLVESVPFLNGSLFTKLAPRERVSRISNEDYVGGDGLLSILSRYDWTLSDRTGYESESAVDPSMLGEMFERLMLAVDGPRLEADGHRKMPGGSYYTPQDIADEMAADAIGARLCARMAPLDPVHARMVAHPAPREDVWREWSAATKRTASRLLASTTVFDPCCGSGVFTLAMLHGLWRAKGRLSSKPLSADDLENIIERQLYATDIHPTAVLITRLRLFIALIDAKVRYGRAGSETKPLPNLETRCIAANTLCVVPSRQDDLGGAEWLEGIDDLRAAREAWTSAHFPDEKDEALSWERDARRQLREIAAGYGVAQEDDLKWLDADFLSASAPPADFDVRQLFPAPDGGWDIVIGNPPYQRPDPPDKARAKRLGYTDSSANLYLMFIEAALKVVKKQGCVSLVVPHSIVFRRDGAFAKTRKLIESEGASVAIRTYDNMPQPLFPKLPWLKTAEHGIQNRQRCTILVVEKRHSRGPSNPCVVSSRGLIRFGASQRNTVLRVASRGIQQPNLGEQWSQAPTQELADLLVAMRSQGPRQRSGRNHKVVTFPPTGMYFISCLPDGVLDQSGRKAYTLVGDKLYWPWIGLYNSHLFHAYWLMVGDAFHITATEYGTVKRPPGWDDEGLRLETERAARRLMHKRTLQACHVVKNNLGAQHNVNFHKAGTPGPAIIEELDDLLLQAYGLPSVPLMAQMRVIRTASAHVL